MDTRADRQSEVADLLGDRLGAADGSSRAVEARKEPVTRRIDLAAAKPCELCAHAPMMLGDE